MPYELNLHALIFRIPLNQFRYILKSGIKVQSVKSILQYFRFFWQKVVIIAIWELERVSNLGLVLNFYPSIVDSLPQAQGLCLQIPDLNDRLRQKVNTNFVVIRQVLEMKCRFSFFGWVSFIFSYINAAIWINFEFHLKKLGNIDILYFPWSNFSIPIMESPIKI